MDVGMRRAQEHFTEKELFSFLYGNVDKKKLAKKKLLFLSTPLATDLTHFDMEYADYSKLKKHEEFFERNMEITKALYIKALNERLVDFIPIAPAFLFAPVLDYSDLVTHKISMLLTQGILSMCQLIWVYKDRITPMMELEIELASKLNIPISYEQLSKKELETVAYNTNFFAMPEEDRFSSAWEECLKEMHENTSEEKGTLR
jgi:hypothetical protein